MSQTSVSAGGQAVGNPGEIADTGPRDINSGFNEATTQMPFGYGVRFGSANNYYVLATGFSVSVPVQGVNLLNANHMPAITLANGTVIGDLGSSGLLQYASLQVMRQGRVLVPVEASPSLGDRAWCRGIGTGSLTPGVWRGAAAGSAPLGGSYHVDCSKQGVFRSTAFTAADGSTLVAVLEVDFVNSNV